MSLSITSLILESDHMGVLKLVVDLAVEKDSSRQVPLCVCVREEYKVSTNRSRNWETTTDIIRYCGVGCSMII